MAGIRLSGRAAVHRAKAVYFYLRDRADSQGLCWPALGTIARELSLSRSTVKRRYRTSRRPGIWKPSSGGGKTGGKSTLQFRLLK